VTRILLALLEETSRQYVHWALECIGSGGGLGIAAVTERE